MAAKARKLNDVAEVYITQRHKYLSIKQLSDVLNVTEGTVEKFVKAITTVAEKVEEKIEEKVEKLTGVANAPFPIKPNFGKSKDIMENHPNAVGGYDGPTIMTPQASEIGDEVKKGRKAQLGKYSDCIKKCKKNG